MLKTLSDLITRSAIDDPKVIFLTGDHGYALFDQLRKRRPDQFINCGVAEQAMVGMAAGLAMKGFKPYCYGLASFIPMRVLEQIKMDVCYHDLPVTFIGAGAGLVYSQLGPSHQCAEDIAVLSPLPNISIYSPCDKWELELAWEDAKENKKPAYIRMGQALNAAIYDSTSRLSVSTNCNYMGHNEKIALFSCGPMAYYTNKIAIILDVHSYSVNKIKPFDLGSLNFGLKKIIVIEEHSEFGGLYSIIKSIHPNTVGICLKNKFSEKCGDYQYALSEHEMDEESLLRRVKELIS